MYRRINSCLSFDKGECPHQKQLERVQTTPQLMDLEELLEYQGILLDCLLCGRVKSRKARRGTYEKNQSADF